MNFKKYFADALFEGLNNKERFKRFCDFLLEEKIADGLSELTVIHASFIDMLGLPEDETRKLKELHEALLPFGLNYKLTYIKKSGSNYPLSVNIVKASREPEPTSQTLDFEEIEGATKMLRFILSYKDILAETDEPTEFNELLAQLRTAELMAAKVSGQSSNMDSSRGNDEAGSDIERKIAELNVRAKMLLGGTVYGDGECYRTRRENSYYIYGRSPKHLYGKQVFTKKNVLDPGHRIVYSREWKFYPNELDILEAFIEHDEEILRNLKAQHTEN